jgi:hypothetical protein
MTDETQRSAPTQEQQQREQDAIAMFQRRFQEYLWRCEGYEPTRSVAAQWPHRLGNHAAWHRSHETLMQTKTTDELFKNFVCAAATLAAITLVTFLIMAVS